MPMADKSVPGQSGAEPPSYEEIVNMLTFLVDVIDVEASKTDDRFVRALYTSLQGSLDAALRVEWASRALDDNGDILYID